jgi:hypothetical protein
LKNSTLEVCKYMVVIRQELYHGITILHHGVQKFQREKMIISYFRASRRSAF